jgi:hypothetical protein
VHSNGIVYDSLNRDFSQQASPIRLTADSILNYVWRTNDIVYLNDSPRGRMEGQYFPLPVWEKSGSKDAFRYFTHMATGGSSVAAETGRDVDFNALVKYLEFLKAVGWIVY